MSNSISLRFVKLNLVSFKAPGFLNALFEINRDFSLQLGYIVFFFDQFFVAVPLIHRSYKAIRTIRSVLAPK